MEQWSFTGGSFRYPEISVFLILLAYYMDMPLINSVAYDDDAMADPHPNVLKTAF